MKFSLRVCRFQKPLNFQPNVRTQMNLVSKIGNQPDHPAWVIALCPNCHRRAHYGSDGPEYNRTLTNRANDLERIP